MSAACGRRDHGGQALVPAASQIVEEPGTYTPGCTGPSIRDRLECIHGIEIVSEVFDPKRNATVYDLRFPQPVHHRGQQKDLWFKQRLVLSHRGIDEPMVLQTSGYSIFGVRDSELSREFQTNQLQIEHRFFRDSVPDEISSNLGALNIFDSATDFHRITLAFKNIYAKPWINTGASKGGMTSMYHRRFYPDDVDATVSYVAPLSDAIWDLRYVDFVDNVGGAEFAACRKQLMDLQRALLTRRQDVLPLVEGAFDLAGGKEVAYEAAVIEMPFGFFQYQEARTECPKIPDSRAAASDLAKFLQDVYGVDDNFGDAALQEFWPYYYQSAGELGYPGARLDHLMDLLRFADRYQIETFSVHKPVPVHRVESMQDIRNWVSQDSQRIMHIYGEFDPWTAGKFDIRAHSESLLYMDGEGTHGAKIATLSPDDQAAAWATLETWFGKTRVQQTALELTDGHSWRAESKHGLDLEDLERQAMRRRR
jgi:hypothetical protein